MNTANLIGPMDGIHHDNPNGLCICGETHGGEKDEQQETEIREARPERSET